ncbi:MAG: NAD(P)H-quinone oxidoreductase subunit 2, chloroplastic [Candidatus Argoarchaeum ethanivorans]|uniref:NAD(P)H-quinone oxidoreductase subunit 2, chloroplastic n=1 Tax=Candidatus Argoarchaeum ethanivorans TaxID=2608793 RepID=A0A811T8G1_9EURY|nr:MAG: NAD(P)H-quinone oxidoreductase subunit 2, chloroplastic [Candidatus Argoarchaeum ethanivorans]
MLSVVEHFPVLIIVISLLSAFTILIAGWLNKKSCCLISFATILVQLVMSIFILHHVLTVGTINYWLGGWSPPWGIEYVVDALNAYVLVILLFLALACVMYSKRNIEHELPHKIVSYYTIYQLLVTGLCGVTVTGDIFNMYVFVEIFSLSAYALIASRGKIALRASYTYLILGSIGACFFLLGIGFLYSVTGTLNMYDISCILKTGDLYNSKVVLAAFGFFIIGLGIKMALFPLHTWLPDAHSFAPAEISAMLSGIIIEVSTYAFIRVCFSVYTVNFLKLLPIFDILCWVAASGIIIGSVLAIAQDNLKRMLAYSSVSQMGYIMLAVGLSVSSHHELWGGLTPALMHILNHALMKGCLFLVAGAFIYKADLWNISDFRGLGKKMPYTCAAFTLAAISMIGVPPSVGFVSKLYIILASLDSGKFVFVVIMLVSTLLNLVYFSRVIETMYMKQEEGAHNHSSSRRDEVPASMLIPILILASLCIIVGILWLTEIPMPIMDSVNSLLGLGAVG